MSRPVHALAIAAALAAPSALQAAPDKTLGMALLSAVVNQDGTIAGGAGAVSSSAIDTGFYQVMFNRDVRLCSYAASHGERIGFLGGVVVSADALPADPQGVFVAVSVAETGSPLNAGFHLMVFCAR